MRRLTLLLLPLMLTACVANTLRVQPAEEWQQDRDDFQVEAATFQEISRQIGQQARSECLRRGNVSNCDFTIVVDLNPRAPANAFQTLDEDNQPVIIFTRSMIESAQNADELAFVMGHEAAHHILRHIPRQTVNARESAEIFGELARLGGADGAGVEKAQKLGAQVGAQVYIKDFELEADQLGTVITYKAGYNPLIGAKYFDRLPDPDDSFLGTHPPNEQRVQIVVETARQLGLSQ
ncbi:Putative Zn-dependent protease [Ruegeria sp. THAF57]|uniref:M48 family metallopeptidase n=1 Tax=Ruegeria sp. THAF57 TaxID=2744555 RepID=UPI0015DEA5E9|nr:M48 family metallopeptidase [Ruegeria sp. THAF57]CAD0183758.1 Putative Zn-dependent protease [Ruegeria sp. THAF57]